MDDMVTTIPVFDLAAQHAALRPALDAAYDRVMSRSQFVLNAEVAGFEAAFASFCAVEACIGVGNGLDALTLALMSLGIGPGDEVIVPAHTFVATWLAVSRVGATPVPCEASDGRYTVTAEDVAPLIGPRSRAVIPVHLYGIPSDPLGISALCADHGLYMIEDAAQAHGSLSKGLPCGSFGHAGCFSFYPTKTLGALGDGGAVVTSDRQLTDRLRMLRNYGSPQRYHVEDAGINSRLDEMQAAFLAVKLGAFASMRDGRLRAADRYCAGLLDVPRLKLPWVAPGDTPCFHLMVVRTSERDALRNHLSESGIQTLVHYPQPVYRARPFAVYAPAVEGEADRLSREVLSLPFWPEMPDSAIDRVVHAIRSFFRV